jgi:CubicO group peptidase (beta-lactamase class C family)
MKIYKLIVLMCCLSFFNCINAQTKKENLSNFIQQTTDSIYNKESLPGIFVGILNNGEKQFFNAGFADPDKKMPFDAATMFEIGSITKTFTAYVLTAVLMQNKIEETDLIVKYLPDSVAQNKNLSSISFLNLMNHTSGLPRLPGNMKPVNDMQPYENYSLKELFSYLQSCKPKTDGKYDYSNLGAGLAGALAEKISGKTYAALLDEYIFLPLKMVTPANSIAVTQNKSTGYYTNDDKAEYWNMNILAPAGGLKCTGAEMLAYLENLCFPKTDYSKNIIDKLTAQTVALNPKIAIGRGWHIFNDKEQPLFYWHNGGTYGFSTFCAFTKNKSKGVIVVINQFSKNALADGLGVKIIKKIISEE